MSVGKFQLDPWIEGYLSYLGDVRRQASGTLRDVRCTLKRVIEGMAEHRPGVELWHLELKDYLQWLERERRAGKTPAHLAKNVSHLRGLLEYAWRSGRAQRNVLDGFSVSDTVPSRPPEVLSEQDARALVEACPARTAWERAERVMVLLLYGCGLRTAELCGLNLGDVDLERREVFVAHGKGDRQRRVPIPGGVWPEVATYLLERGGKRGALFLTPAKQHRVNAHLVSAVVKGAASRAGIAKLVTAKTLRHSYATHLMERGVDLAVISELMGHRSPTETGVYLHVLPQRPRKAVERLEEGGKEQP